MLEGPVGANKAGVERRRFHSHFEGWSAAVLQTLRENPLLTFFIVLALVVRLFFWFYTGRIWEDALITITAARNVWEGFGLTHHASEPRVHSFTSPISVLIPLVAEPFNAGLLAMRLSSLAASVATIYFAYRIGTRLAFHWAAQVLVLGYLACDQLQVFFGMGGMETQVVTAIALATLHFYLSERWRLLGLACGLATISRPEFIMFLLPPIGLALLLFHRRAILRVALPALSIAVPWYAFAIIYYGSPVPNTIVAKSLSYRIGLFSASWANIWNFTVGSWRDFAPFKQFWCVIEAPLPDIVLKIIVGAVVLLFLAGLMLGAFRQPKLLVAGAAVLGFLAYRNSTVMISYYMWYLPPFTALAVIVSGYALSQLALKAPGPASALGFVLAICYAMHLPFSMPLDKKVEQEIEVKVRERTGHLLNRLMTEPDDTAVLEPLGFIGWAAFNKTLYDYPGLGSKVAVGAVKKMQIPGVGVAALVDGLQPTHAVLRPNEFDELQKRFPATADKYEVVTRVQAATGLTLRHMGYEYWVSDDDFRILRRTRAFAEVVRP